jgi:hypothetical protein
MLIAYALARPFSQWNLTLGDGEPAHGYFARLVANECHTSVRVYADQVGLMGRNIVPDEMLAALKRLPISQERVKSLEMWTPVREGNRYRIGTETLKLKQLSWTSRRWCRSCLGEAPHHRIWWDIQCYQVCPRHREQLVEQTEGGVAIRWNWPHFDIGPDNDLLAKGEKTVVDVGDLNLERLIEARLLGQPFELLRDHRLYQVIDMCAFLGQFLTGEENAHNVGFEALMLDEVQLRGKLSQRIVERTTPQQRRQGLASAMGDVVYSGMRRRGGALGAWIEQQLLQAFADVGRIGRKRFRGPEIERREFTLVEAAARLELAPKALSRFAKHCEIGHTPWKDAHSFSDDDIKALRDKIAELITLPETIEITGVPAHEFRFLERAGFINGYHLGTVSGVQGVRYVRSEVVALVERAWATAGTDECEAMTLFSCAKTRGIKQGEVMTMVITGELVPCRLDLEAIGFRRLMFK